MNFVLLANLASTLFLTGLAWSLQLVQLPVLQSAGVANFALHRQLNTRLMILPMAIEFGTALWLARTAPLIVAFLLWCVIGLATIRYSLLHRNFANRGRLGAWNWVRTLAWTARSGILLWIAAGRFRI